MKNRQELLTVTYSFRPPDCPADQPFALAELCNDSIRYQDEEAARAAMAADGNDSVPAVKVARLAVLRGAHRKKIGSAFLNAIKKILLECMPSGCRYITVDALNTSKVLNFYRRNDFTSTLEAEAEGNAPEISMYCDLLPYFNNDNGTPEAR